MSDGHSAVAPGRAAAVAALVTALACLWVLWGTSRDPGYVSDFDQCWYAARMLWAGRDPYAAALAAPPTAANPIPMGLYYPLPAIVATSPLALLPLWLARLVWVGGGAFAYVYLLVRQGGYAKLPAAMSGAFAMAVSLGQWSLVLACAVMAPGFGWFVPGKPNVGLAAVASARRPIGLALVALIPVALSFAFWPGWLPTWRSSVATGYFSAYVMRPGGVLLLLALLRWRRPEARWLAAMACVPATPGPADAAMAFAFRMSFRDALVLALLTHAPALLMRGQSFSTFAAYVERLGTLTLVLVYLPVLIGILVRPNVGDPPAWVEHASRLWRRDRGSSSSPSRPSGPQTS